MLVCVFLCMFAHETAGAARTRLSLRPLVLIEGGNRRKARAHRAARSRGCVCDTRCLKIESADIYRARMRHMGQRSALPLIQPLPALRHAIQKRPRLAVEKLH